MQRELRPFMDEDFLLESEAARRLYHEYAENLPIIDYHCHLPVAQIAEDHRFGNLTEAWLYGDHYKWRAMRACGVDEAYCTGDRPDWNKFAKWAATVPQTLRNPLYHWTHLELKRVFGISDRLLCPETARDIWETCNSLLARPEFSCRNLMKKMNVVAVCTTDDPVDSLEHHRALAADSGFGIEVRPAWRPDRGMAVEAPPAFNAWVDKLGAAADMKIGSFEAYLEALARRHAFFHEMGCRLSDHGIENVCADGYTDRDAAAIFLKVRMGSAPSPHEVRQFRSAMLHEFAVMDHEKGWVQQLHLGALRNVNTRMLERLGPDTGFDTIGDFEQARPLVGFLDRLNRAGKLAKTILYNLNPSDNAVLAALAGCFNEGPTPGKIQFGSAWWFLDQKHGIEAHLNTLSNLGLLGTFVGMLTDSRSFLSYPRHEYFRRILCNLLGADMEAGLVPWDFDLVGSMTRDICFFNAKHYFDFSISSGKETDT